MVNFTLVNGQVYTPGLAIIDAPQPNTPLGGDNLQIAIDVSGNGKLPWPPSTDNDSATQFHDIRFFLTSESLSHNFTISNGTTPSTNTSYVGPVLDLEPSSTVKHVNWIWPKCLVGDGSGSKSNSDRGAYNISMHQSFRWNGTDYYTVFQLPISVTNSISESDERVDCALLENELLSVAEVDESSDSLPGQPWIEGVTSVNWNNEAILRSHWSRTLLDLSSQLGPENIFISIYESGSYDNTKGALRDLDWELERLRVPRNITLSHITHEDEMAAPARGEGWVRTTAGGARKLRRVPYLARPSDVFELLNTNDGEYGAACSLDFSKPPNFYDTFALRDIRGHEAVMSTWPYFRTVESRYAMKSLSPVPVASCWNGMVAMPAGPFLATSPLRFRGIPDSLAEYHLEGSECCLIHADNPLSEEKGVYLNPRVRVGYTGQAYAAVKPISNWLTAKRILQGLWVNRVRRWSIAFWVKEEVVRRRVDSWKALDPKNDEPGQLCIIDEMQILHRNSL
ncbi:hypothetical protein PENANT_c004G06730 [Penicillium antarcticum]|uniref:Uncharacterized protein n=1 Tax=Penicillium antarcticum TaxID=416450 RepID=A0A1V6QGG2_9EURO|nr:hypothetical protein PENANT_c004G06730 [Penicillium antarcticum]